MKYFLQVIILQKKFPFNTDLYRSTLYCLWCRTFPAAGACFV